MEIWGYIIFIFIIYRIYPLLYTYKIFDIYTVYNLSIPGKETMNPDEIVLIQNPKYFFCNVCKTDKYTPLLLLDLRFFGYLPTISDPYL